MEKDELSKRLYEKERELSYVRSNNGNENYDHRLPPPKDNYLKNDIQTKKNYGYENQRRETKDKIEVKRRNDQKINEFEHKIDGIERTINDLKISLTQKEKNLKNQKTEEEYRHFPGKYENENCEPENVFFTSIWNLNIVFFFGK